MGLWRGWGEGLLHESLEPLLQLLHQKIGEHPNIGRLSREPGSGLISFAHGNHLIFLMDWQGETAILRALHDYGDRCKTLQLSTAFQMIQNAK